ncbi:MAG: hypothetical protein MI976_30625, partial [Pseudomonadales bacterium]|nr:hypothetical protein [Pseudomonadales bacterium]
LAILRPFESDAALDLLVEIDIENFVDVGESISGSGGRGYSEVASIDTDNNPDGISATGIFSSIVPLFDGTDRAIVSWSFCRLLNENGTIRSCNGVDLTEDGLVPAPPNFGLWLFDFKEDTQIPLILNQSEGQSYVEMAIAQPRDIPTSIVDTSPRYVSPQDTTCDPAYFEEDDGFGMIHIRSVYDMDGSFYTDWAPEDVTSIAQLADPVAVASDERVARFVRFEKPVYMPDPELKDVGNNTSRFGPAMREVLGYAPVQPDGSVKIKVPADVPFMLTIVDQYGRRVAGSEDHMNWMQVRPGEVLECKGCHQSSSDYPHGRSDAQSASLNSGANSMTMFPNTGAAAYEVDISVAGDGSALETCLPFAGETMADVFVRTNTDRANISSDIVFEDVWTDPAQRTPDDAFAYRYSQIRTVYDTGEDNGDTEIGLVPFNRGECIDDWNAFCRGIINYDDHIQPLWEVTRTVTTDDGPTNYKCIDCHHEGGAEAPAGQLSLVRGDDDRAISYTDLQNNAFAVSATGQELNGVTARDMDNNVIAELEKQADGRYCYRWPDGRLINPTIVNETEEVEVVIDEETTIIEIREVLDDDGDPIPLTFTIRESNLGLNTRISRAGASNSNRFRTLFEPDFSYSYFDCGTQTNVSIGEIEFDHSAPGLFSEAELKMLWEWLDIGSAYYNNPFDVPD